MAMFFNLLDTLIWLAGSQCLIVSFPWLEFKHLSSDLTGDSRMHEPLFHFWSEVVICLYLTQCLPSNWYVDITPLDQLICFSSAGSRLIPTTRFLHTDSVLFIYIYIFLDLSTQKVRGIFCECVLFHFIKHTIQHTVVTARIQKNIVLYFTGQT